jgi:hypothetical protein
MRRRKQRSPMRERLEALSATIVGEGPRETAAFLRAEPDKWGAGGEENGRPAGLITQS